MTATGEPSDRGTRQLDDPRGDGTIGPMENSPERPRSRWARLATAWSSTSTTVRVVVAAAVVAAITVAVIVIGGGGNSDSAAPSTTLVELSVPAIGGGTDAEVVELDPDAANPRRVTIEQLRWAPDGTVEAAVFIDDCTTPSAITANRDGERIAVAVTVGDTAATDCPELHLVAVRATVDPLWAELELVEADPSADTDPAVEADTEGTP